MQRGKYHVVFRGNFGANENIFGNFKALAKVDGKTQEYSPHQLSTQLKGHHFGSFYVNGSPSYLYQTLTFRLNVATVDFVVMTRGENFKIHGFEMEFIKLEF